MTPDVNVLVAGSRLDHPHHGPALVWLDAALKDCEQGRPLAIYPMVAAGFLRLVTHPKVFVRPTPYDAVLAHHDHLVSFDKGFRRFLKSNEFTVLRT